MSPRTKLFVLVVLAAAVGLAQATGAFTSVQAQRTAEVNVAGDDSALLQLDPTDEDSPAALNDGQLTITLNDVNADAITRLQSVFTITNTGEDAITVYIEESGDNTAAIDAGVLASDLVSDDIENPQGDTNDGIRGANVADISHPSPDPGSIGVRLEPGESITVGLYIDTSDTNVNNGLDEGGPGELGPPGTNLWRSLTIYAEQDAPANFEADS